VEPLEPWRIVTQLVAVPLLLCYCLVRKRSDLLIIAACIVAMAGYGMVQDQFSVRMSPEYFTVGHPPIEGLHDPTLLGVAWGFLGGWWGGMLMGISLGLTATLGRAPRLTVREVLPGVGWLLLAIAGGTLLAGGSAWYNGGITQVRLGGGFAEAVPAAGHRAFLTVACAHLGTYLTAGAGTAVLCLHAARLRRGKAAGAPPPLPAIPASVP
jgi:hypothetical protein